MKLLPTRAAVLALALPAALTALALVAPLLKWGALGLDGVIFLVLAVDAWRARPVALRLERTVAGVWSAGRPERVHLKLENSGNRSVTVEVQQSLFEYSRSEGLPLTLLAQRGGMAEGSYRVMSTRRGRYPLGFQHLRYGSPWGFWQRQEDLPETQEIQVWPDVKALSEYDLLARTNRQGLLMRTIKRPGSESEFDRLRPYQRGDEYRTVDWKASARARQPIVRQLRQATDQNLMFLLDCGRTMRAETEGRPALDYALDALLLVSHVAARQGDRAGLIAFDGSVRSFLPPVGGPSASRTLLQTVCDLHPSLEEPDYAEAFALLRARVRRRSLVVLFSNLVDEPTAELLQKLFASANRHLVVWVCLRDPGMESLLEAKGTEEAPYLRGAAAEVLVWRKKVLDTASAHGVMVLDVNPRDFTPALLDRYLEVKARQLL